MRIELTLPDGQQITLTTEHSASSYGQPVVLVNGVVIDAHVNMELDEPELPSALDSMSDDAGIHDGAVTRSALYELTQELAQQPSEGLGAWYDRIISEFKKRGKALREKEEK